MSGSQSGTVSFSNIPPNIRIPLFYVQFDNSQAGANQQVKRTLIIGQTLISQPAVPTFNPSVEFSMGSYGAGSMLSRMYTAYRANDTFGEVHTMPLADLSGGTKGSGSITFAATSAAVGTFPLYVAGQSVPFTVNSGDSATTIGANAAAAINAIITMPCSATAASGVVTMTANHKGVAGGALDVRVAYLGIRSGEVVPSGVTYTISAFSGGAGDPDLAAIAAAIGDSPYDYIVHPYTGATQMGEVKALMGDQSGRWSPMSQVFGGAFTALVATSSALLTFGAANNDQHTVCVGVYDTPTPAFEWAAAWTGAVAPSLTADPAMPLQTLPISAVLAPPHASRFTKTVQQSLLTTGVALASFDQTGAASVLRGVTTYQTNTFGQADQSYLDCETLFTLMEITRRLQSAITQKFSRAKLADDGTAFGPGQLVVTPTIIFGEIAAQYAAMERDGLVENAAAMTAATKVMRNSNDPSRVDVLFAPYLISGLRIFAVLNQFRLLAA